MIILIWACQIQGQRKNVRCALRAVQKGGEVWREARWYISETPTLWQNVLSIKLSCQFGNQFTKD